MEVFIVEIVPTKASKSSFIAGVYSSFKLAQQAAIEETTKSNAYWWTNYRILSCTLDDGFDSIRECPKSGVSVVK